MKPDRFTIPHAAVFLAAFALGIAVDNAIYLLARYRLELKLTGQNLALSVDRAVREVSVGIIYTSVVLFCGYHLRRFAVRRHPRTGYAHLHHPAGGHVHEFAGAARHAALLTNA